MSFFDCTGIAISALPVAACMIASVMSIIDDFNHNHNEE